MCKMIARRRHDEMEVAIRVSTIASGYNRLEGSRRLFERDTCLVCIAA